MLAALRVRVTVTGIFASVLTVLEGLGQTERDLEPESDSEAYNSRLRLSL